MEAKAIYYSILAALSAAGSAVAWALGGWDTALQTLVILMAIDYITGVLCALVWKRSPKSESGAFESKARPARKARNPRTGEEIKIAASKAPVFKAGKALKDKVNTPAKKKGKK